MERLHERFNAFFTSGEIEPLLLIPSYVLGATLLYTKCDFNSHYSTKFLIFILKILSSNSFLLAATTPVTVEGAECRLKQ